MEPLHSTQAVHVEFLHDQHVGGCTARIADIPAYGEGETEEEALADLKEALRGYIETFGLEDALAHLQSSVTIRSIHLNLADLAE